MVWLYTDECCEQGRHEFCSGGNKPTPGTFGGSKCTCKCHIKKEKKYDLDVWRDVNRNK